MPNRARILVVLTNHSAYPSRPDRTGLWLAELTHFLDIVDVAGYDSDFVSPHGGPVPLDERSLGWLYLNNAMREHLGDPAFIASLRNTKAAAQVDPADYAAIYYAGGHGTMWDFCDSASLTKLGERIYRQGGVVSAVCHGVAGLLDLKDEDGRPLVAGRKVTGFSNSEEWLSGLKSQVPFLLEDELIARGAHYSKAWLPFTSFVVVDGRIATGQNPGSSKAIAKAVVALLAERPLVKEGPPES
ncbi:type 1 glutamine amidotransferase domain-containing protein [Labrys okinawensis]|uniref:type 1 glutamine amidotransferase domain-containing protein n=1 Tax=Labrys okinawensis TaxID=346911 RepID=UPI0039BCFB24